MIIIRRVSTFSPRRIRSLLGGLGGGEGGDVHEYITGEPTRIYLFFARVSHASVEKGNHY